MAMFDVGYALAALAGLASKSDLGLESTGVAAEFLTVNSHSAQVFFGDGRSIQLGFLAGALGFWGLATGHVARLSSAARVSPLFEDTKVALLRRLACGEESLPAYREHYYQRIVRLGMGHVGTALTL
jgi:UDP-N-acetylmuramyl pentapeptide phosphotransferase/UDP-N-acetylglucosamine-1-phosphate transferase